MLIFVQSKRIKKEPLRILKWNGFTPWRTSEITARRQSIRKLAGLLLTVRER